LLKSIKKNLNTKISKNQKEIDLVLNESFDDYVSTQDIIKEKLEMEKKFKVPKTREKTPISPEITEIYEEFIIEKDKINHEENIENEENEENNENEENENEKINEKEIINDEEMKENDISIEINENSEEINENSEEIEDIYNMNLSPVFDSPTQENRKKLTFELEKNIIEKTQEFMKSQIFAINEESLPKTEEFLIEIIDINKNELIENKQSQIFDNNSKENSQKSQNIQWESKKYQKKNSFENMDPVKDILFPIKKTTENNSSQNNKTQEINTSKEINSQNKKIKEINTSKSKDSQNNKTQEINTSKSKEIYNSQNDLTQEINTSSKSNEANNSSQNKSQEINTSKSKEILSPIKKITENDSSQNNKTQEINTYSKSNEINNSNKNQEINTLKSKEIISPIKKITENNSSQNNKTQEIINTSKENSSPNKKQGTPPIKNSKENNSQNEINSPINQKKQKKEDLMEIIEIDDYIPSNQAKKKTELNESILIEDEKEIKHNNSLSKVIPNDKLNDSQNTSRQDDSIDLDDEEDENEILGELKDNPIKDININNQLLKLTKFDSNLKIIDMKFCNLKNDKIAVISKKKLKVFKRQNKKFVMINELILYKENEEFEKIRYSQDGKVLLILGTFSNGNLKLYFEKEKITDINIETKSRLSEIEILNKNNQNMVLLTGKDEIFNIKFDNEWNKYEVKRNDILMNTPKITIFTGTNFFFLYDESIVQIFTFDLELKFQILEEKYNFHQIFPIEINQSSFSCLTLFQEKKENSLKKCGLFHLNREGFKLINIFKNNQVNITQGK
jgi:hypothetical protein